MIEPEKDHIDAWLDKVVYLDDDTKERRDILFDNDRNRLFFFAHPLDFDKDDTYKPARYWLDELEGWQEDFHKVIKDRCVR